MVGERVPVVAVDAPVKVVISLSTCAEKLAGHREEAFCGSRRCACVREPASATIAAASVASPSLPFGSCAEPTLEEELHVELRQGERARRSRPSARRVPPGANEASAGSVAIASGSAPCASVVCTSPASTVKYFSAAAGGLPA
jgi:hypothetical protein